MAPARSIAVRMCEAHTGSGTDRLHATLGSCVGIGLLWKKQGRCALAHCLLPEAPVNDQGSQAKYVSAALPLLLNKLGVPPSRYRELQAVLAGGANMVVHSRAPRHGQIGEQNSRMAQRLLSEAGIPIIHTDLGGDCGRRLEIDCSNFEYHSRLIQRPN